MAVEAAPGAAPAVVEAPAPARPASNRGGDRVRSWILGVWSGLAVLYLFIPIFIVILFSFNNPKGRFNFTWQGFTLDHWLHPFADPDLASAMPTEQPVPLAGKPERSKGKAATIAEPPAPAGKTARPKGIAAARSGASTPARS